MQLWGFNYFSYSVFLHFQLRLMRPEDEEARSSFCVYLFSLSFARHQRSVLAFEFVWLGFGATSTFVPKIRGELSNRCLLSEKKHLKMLNESFVLGNVKRGFATWNYAFFVCLKRSFRVWFAVSFYVVRQPPSTQMTRVNCIGVKLWLAWSGLRCQGDVWRLIEHRTAELIEIEEKS